MNYLETYLFTEAPERGVDLSFALLVFVDQEIKHVNSLDHAVVCGLETLGWRNDVVPSRLTSNPELDAFILCLAVGIVCNFVDDNALRRVVRFEDCR
jgi:hypothetical protein